LICSRDVVFGPHVLVPISLVSIPTTFYRRIFRTKKSNKKILRWKIILSHMFQWPTKVSSKNIRWFIFCLYTLIYFCLYTLIYFFVKSLPWPIDIHGPKIYFYGNIFLSKFCVQKCLVWRGPLESLFNCSFIIFSNCIFTQNIKMNFFSVIKVKHLGGNSQNFLWKFVRFFLTLGLKILRLFGLKVLFEADIIKGWC